MTQHHRPNGRSTHYVDADGQTVAKLDRTAGFVAWTVLSAVGLSLVLVSFTGPAWLVIPGALVALFAVSQSHPYRQYTHWYGLVAAVLAIGGPLAHLLDLLGAGGGFLGR